MSIYVGPNSVARLPQLDKLNHDMEVIQKCYVLGYDTHNDILLTKDPARYKKTSISEIRSRFADLKRICRKHSPQKLRTVEAIERLSIDNHEGRIGDRSYLHRLRLIALSNGLNTMFLDQAEARVNMAEGIPFQRFKSSSKGKLNNIFHKVGRTVEKTNRPNWFGNVPHERRNPGKGRHIQPRPKKRNKGLLGGLF